MSLEEEAPLLLSSAQVFTPSINCLVLVVVVCRCQRGARAKEDYLHQCKYAELTRRGESFQIDCHPSGRSMSRDTIYVACTHRAPGKIQMIMTAMTLSLSLSLE